MRLKSGCIAILALALVVPFSAHAMTATPKSIELNGFFTFDHNSVSVDNGGDGSATTFDFEPALGYFFNSQWEVLGKLVFDHESFGEGTGTTSFGLTGDALYHFKTSGSVVPFVGGGLGILTNGGDGNDNTDNTTIIAPELFAGVRLPFKEIVSVNFTGGYRHTSSPYGIDDASGNEFFLGAGFSFFFRGGITQ